MHRKSRFHIVPEGDFWQKALHWAKSYSHACYLDGNGYSEYPYQPFPKMLAVGKPISFSTEFSVFDILATKNQEDWWFGYLSYEVKNELFNLQSKSENRWDFPQAAFFAAKVLIQGDAHFAEISAPDPETIWRQISNQKLPKPAQMKATHILDFQNKESYCKTIEEIKEGIRNGHVYELNYCRFFECETDLDGLEAYLGLRDISPTPFSGWFKSNDHEIVSASPERYLKKTGTQLISQPIKGTAPRNFNPDLDKKSAYHLLHSEKERAENLMIVDLVRNDLSRVSVPGSTEVPELFGIYSFPQVHQMISTVTSKLQPNKTWVDAIRYSFPMGSMTGAPKLEVIKWIDQLETQQRGPFSGALGYIGPGNDFDFNVLIRSLFINHQLGKTGFAVGSAITIDAEPEAEWEECENKALAIRKWLGGI